jgi:large conductance mechanosensitive channel
VSAPGAGILYADAKKQGAVLGWGQFLTVAINFLIIAWVLFLAIKGM